MANEHKIEINKRDNITPQGLKQLRREGNIPGIYYSASSKESVPIFITQKNYQEAVKSGSRIFNIFVGDKITPNSGSFYLKSIFHEIRGSHQFCYHTIELILLKLFLYNRVRKLI